MKKDDDGDQSVDRDDFYHKLNEDSLIGPPMVEYKLGPKEIEGFYDYEKLNFYLWLTIFTYRD